MIQKIFLVFLIIISIFISINSIIFLPIAAFLIATLLTNTNEFSLTKNKKVFFYFVAVVTILSLISISKFV